MRCKPGRSSAWMVATPLFPIIVAAWVSGATRRKSGSSDCAGKDRQSRSTGRKAAPRPATADIVDTAVEAGAFETLVKAVKAAGLVDTLKGDGPFTVFAPVDEAFAKLPKKALADLLKDKKRLTSVLLRHVVPGRVPASALSSYAAVRTVGEDTLDIDTNLGVKVGSAYVIQADIEASNGIVHAIDSVLLDD